MQLQAAVFVRASGAFGLGHVGWCFGLDPTLFDDGSVENPPGTPFTPPNADGFWNIATTLPIGPFRYKAYDHFKVFSVAAAYPDRALEVVSWISQQPYFVLGRNCMDDVYDVLRAFGMQNLVPPYVAWIPNVWFQELPGQAQPIPDPPLEWTFGKRPTEATWRQLPPVVQEQRLDIVEAKCPPWRTPGTKEFAGLQAEISKIPKRK
jgi:hypothetical protein